MIKYFTEDISFVFKEKLITKQWLKSVATEEGKTLGEVNIIFCSDPYLLDINKQYLQHDYYTDIITFDYCEEDTLSGDLFISIDSVRENASLYNATFQCELRRVIVHGLLHLIGYDDHTAEDQKMMRSKEDYYLLRRESVC